MLLLVPVEIDDPLNIGEVVHLRSSPIVPLTVIAVVDRAQQLPKSLWTVRVFWLDNDRRPQTAVIPEVALRRGQDR
jgi:hypothetical protein